MEGDCLLHQVYPWHMLGGFDSGGVDEEPEADRKTVEDLDELKMSRIRQEQISTIKVNLKVSNELLQQIDRSLDRVEKHLDHRRKDQLDSVTALRDTGDWRHWTAVGPPRKEYSLLVHKGYEWAKNLEDQLRTGKFEFLSEEELDLWESHYPPPAEELQCEQDRLLEASSAAYMTDLSQYRSAQDHILSEEKDKQVHEAVMGLLNKTSSVCINLHAPQQQSVCITLQRPLHIGIQEAT